jgi:hypothetical protein
MSTIVPPGLLNDDPAIGLATKDWNLTYGTTHRASTAAPHASFHANRKELNVIARSATFAESITQP